MMLFESAHRHLFTLNETLRYAFNVAILIRRIERIAIVRNKYEKKTTLVKWASKLLTGIISSTSYHEQILLNKTLDFTKR